MRRYIGTILGVCTILPAMWWAYEIGKEEVGDSRIAPNLQAPNRHEIASRLSNMENENIRLQRELENRAGKISDITTPSRKEYFLKKDNDTKQNELVHKSQHSSPEIVKVNNPFINNRKWYGHYICTQGRTSLTLRIKSASNQAEKTELGLAYDVSGIFDFDYKNRTATGAFYIYGKYYPETKVAIFEPGEWIRNPAGYISAGMDGIVSLKGTKFSGKILFKGCESFSLTALQSGL